MSIEVRNARTDEYAAALEVISSAFLERPDVTRVAAWVGDHWDADRTWVAFDGGRACGTFRSTGTDLTVPGGGSLPAAAVSAVTVLPTHRRRGILTAMGARAHAALRERGDAVAILYSSAYPIYGRFGYGPATRTGTLILDARTTGFHGPPVAGMELVTADAAVVSAVAGVHEAWRVRQAGEIRRRPVSWDVRLGLEEDPWDGRWKGFVALHRDAAGDVDGYVRYRAQPKWEDREARGVLAVDDLLALNDAAYAALWRFLAEVDLVATVNAEGRPVSERLPWLLTNARAARLTDVGDALWVRVFDVARALEARSWERSGSLVLEVIDDSVAGGRSRVVLDASPDGATCRPTDGTPDLSVPVAAIGAAYLGGTRLRDAAVATGFDEHRAGALAAADGMFKSGEEPWCSTHF